MNDIQILRQNPSKVLESFKAGEVERMELSVEQITDEFMRQWKEGLWDMTKFTSTSLVQVIYHVICVLLAYNLCQIYSNTKSGQRFAQTTLRSLRSLRRQQIRNHDVSMVVYAGNSYAVFHVKFLIWLLLDQPKDIQERLRPHFMSGFT